MKRNQPRATRKEVNYSGEDYVNKDDKEDYQPDPDSSPQKRSLPQSLQPKKKKAKKKTSKKASSKKTDESDDKMLNGFPKYLANERLQSKLIHQYNKSDLQMVVEQMSDGGVNALTRRVNALTKRECQAILTKLGKSLTGSKTDLQDKVRLISNRREGK